MGIFPLLLSEFLFQEPLFERGDVIVRHEDDSQNDERCAVLPPFYQEGCKETTTEA